MGSDRRQNMPGRAVVAQRWRPSTGIRSAVICRRPAVRKCFSPRPRSSLNCRTNLKDGTREERIFQLADAWINGKKTAAGVPWLRDRGANGGLPRSHDLGVNGKGKLKVIWLYAQIILSGPYDDHQSANRPFDGL